MKKIGVIGAGSWGTALAVTLANKGHQVKIWAHRTKHVAEMKADREKLIKMHMEAAKKFN